MEMKMTSEIPKQIYIPFVNELNPKEKIQRVFGDILHASIDRIDCEPRKHNNRSRSEYYICFVYIKEWLSDGDSASRENVAEQFSSKGKAKLILPSTGEFADKYWTLLPNKSPRSLDELNDEKLDQQRIEEYFAKENADFDQQKQSVPLLLNIVFDQYLRLKFRIDPPPIKKDFINQLHNELFANKKIPAIDLFNYVCDFLIIESNKLFHITMNSLPTVGDVVPYSEQDQDPFNLYITQIYHIDMNSYLPTVEGFVPSFEQYVLDDFDDFTYTVESINYLFHTFQDISFCL